MHSRSSLLLVCVLALCLTTTVLAESLELYTVRALSHDEVPPNSFEPQYADASELQQLKQEREQQMQEENQSASPQQSSPTPSSSSSSPSTASHEATVVQHNDDGSNTAFLLKDVVIHDSTMETKAPAMLEFEPLTPAEAMFYPYVQAQIQNAAQLQNQAQSSAQSKRKMGSRFMQMRAPAGESAGSPGYSSYAAVVEGSAPGSYGSNPNTPMGTFRPLVNLYSDGTPYPLDMRKYDYFRTG